MPLTEAVEFKAVLGRGNRFQLPKLVRWKFKLETSQILKVTVFPAKSYTGECFYAKMDKSGRITVPKVVQNEFLECAFGLQSLIGTIMHVRLAPALNTKSH